ncbi:hypothetical protein TSH58p_03555 [Azospirillum sp. TSH58]|uniref:hypothetical protein n=1 Tax=Azospirillum sp. TSH58 TaxID=664962 RepID=UPI000D6023A1|nr:hypothetical protein [Azospirillum sp. TSH58]AWJ82674.1 hypothetical protein TSH58p_03555 [Azospirillum sp. TSH58]PWC69976.1 hypothetical protein TSH58_14330 [Azospirillum sp. TSH58]
MINDAAVRVALHAVLADGPIPEEDIGRLGDFSFQPSPDRVHLRISLIWERKAKTGAVLTEASGIWQVLVYAPEGAQVDAVESLALSLGLLYEPYVDGPQLADMVRITDVQTLTAVDGQDRPANDGTPGLCWVVVPLQVDFRMELIPDGIV